MADPVVLTTPPADLAGLNAPRTAQPAALDPVETKMFANMMQGVAVHTPTSAATPDTLRDAAMAVSAQLGGQMHSYEEMRRGMLESVDLSDPIKTMFVLTDYSMQANTMFTKLHIASGLASAATSLFGGLLKNQQ